ncbi:MAG: hypothetical protein IJS66_05025 [Bacteroidales bacterium]|nr:hypothetical protein [Bacteroidales bacterium]
MRHCRIQYGRRRSRTRHHRKDSLRGLLCRVRHGPRLRPAPPGGGIRPHQREDSFFHAGITLGEDGATHQTMEDIALMRALPGMAVVVPCDYNQTKNATVAAAAWEGPVYLRFGRPAVPNFTPADEPFEIGKTYVLNEGKDVAIITCGHLVWEALQAAEALEAEGISAAVLNVATIKPLDTATILSTLAVTGCAVVAEEHNAAGGLGEAVAAATAASKPAVLEFVNGGDRFGQSGTPAELMNAWGFDAAHLAEAAKKAISRK